MDGFIIIFELLISIIIFGVLFLTGRFIYNKLNESESRVLNPLEYFPEEEVQTLKQVFYLIMMLIFFVFILYIIISPGNDFIGIIVLQLIVSVYVALTLDYSTWNNKILFFLLIPYEAIAFLVFRESILIWPIHVIHILVYAYLMKVYYDKFKHYTLSNSLGITILLLFSLIFASFIVTSFAEGVDFLSSLVMVSNAFTSNGYAILGNTGVGKLTALVLVWGGYIISGVSTATLTAAILMKRHQKSQNELHERLDELEALIKKDRE